MWPLPPPLHEITIRHIFSPQTIEMNITNFNKVICGQSTPLSQSSPLQEWICHHIQYSAHVAASLTMNAESVSVTARAEEKNQSTADSGRNCVRYNSNDVSKIGIGSKGNQQSEVEGEMGANNNRGQWQVAVAFAGAVALVVAVVMAKTTMTANKIHYQQIEQKQHQ